MKQILVILIKVYDRKMAEAVLDSQGTFVVSRTTLTRWRGAELISIETKIGSHGVYLGSRGASLGSREASLASCEAVIGSRGT